MEAPSAARALAVIPARYASSRFPGKALFPLAGKPMIQHVVERTRGARWVSRVIVATDDERIRKAVEGFGGEAMMTRADHRSGTDRLAEVAARESAEILVNVQGDEPLIAPAAIDLAVETLASDTDVAIATLATPILTAEALLDPNIVKVVMDFDSNALYFSRSPIPFVRDATPASSPHHFKHIGLYVYRREALAEFPTLPPGELEREEQLEQLRWLENGYRIRVAVSDHDSWSVDVPEDAERVTEQMAGGADREN